MKVWISDELSIVARHRGAQDQLSAYSGLEFTFELLLEIIQNPKNPAVVPTIINKHYPDTPPAALIGDVLLCHPYEW